MSSDVRPSCRTGVTRSLLRAGGQPAQPGHHADEAQAEEERARAHLLHHLGRVADDLGIDALGPASTAAHRAARPAAPVTAKTRAGWRRRGRGAARGARPPARPAPRRPRGTAGTRTSAAARRCTRSAGRGIHSRHVRRAHHRTQGHQQGRHRQRRQVGRPPVAGHGHQRQQQQRGADAVEDVDPEDLGPAALEAGQHVLLQAKQVGQRQDHQAAHGGRPRASSARACPGRAGARSRWPRRPRPGTGTGARGSPSRAATRNQPAPMRCAGRQPGVEAVRQDHEDHGHAAQPVDDQDSRGRDREGGGGGGRCQRGKPTRTAWPARSPASPRHAR